MSERYRIDPAAVSHAWRTTVQLLLVAVILLGAGGWMRGCQIAELRERIEFLEAMRRWEDRICP